MKTLRRRAPYLAAAAVIAIFVVSLVLFVNRYDTDNSNPSAGDAPSSGAGAGSNDLTASPSPSASAAASGGPAGGAVTGLPSTLPRRTVSAGVPGGFKYSDAPSHKIVLRVTSPAATPILGYLVPTSPDHSYGRVDKPGRSWTVSTTAYGKPSYAAIFVQAGNSEEPVTCTIEIDGKVASTQVTSGRFGRRLCVA